MTAGLQMASFGQAENHSMKPVSSVEHQPTNHDQLGCHFHSHPRMTSITLPWRSQVSDSVVQVYRSFHSQQEKLTQKTTRLDANYWSLASQFRKGVALEVETWRSWVFVSKPPPGEG